MNCNTTHYRANSSSVPGDPTANGWRDLGSPPSLVSGRTLADEMLEKLKRQRAGMLRGEVEIRQVARRQVYVGGEPAGKEFE